MINLIVGPAHSGTSFVTKLLIDHGADPGLYDSATNERIDYIKYENTELKTYVISLLGIQTDIPIEKGLDYRARFEAFLAGLSPHKVYVLKYPRSLFVLPHLRELIGPRLRVIYVNRSVEAWLGSHQRRSGGSREELLLALNQHVTQLMLYPGPVLKVNFEELLEGKGVEILCRFAGLL